MYKNHPENYIWTVPKKVYPNTTTQQIPLVRGGCRFKKMSYTLKKISNGVKK